MRILFFIHSLSAGGAERVTTTLANHWAGKGWQVTVVTIARRDRDFYGLDQGIQRIDLGLEGISANLWQAFNNNLHRVWALRRVLRQEKPDVAVAMMTTANALLAVAGWKLPILTVGSERVHPLMAPLGHVWETVRRWSYPRLSGMVAQTMQSATWLLAQAPAPHIEVIPNPVNFPMAMQAPRVAPVTTLEESGCSHILLAVGRLELQKGFDRLINAFAAVHKNHSQWVLVILGEGCLGPQLVQQAASLNVAHRVRFPGAVGNVGEWFGMADCYVLTSRFEGFPNTLLEALAHGVPSVAVDCDTGPREILRHEVDGLLVPQDDPDALVAALDRLMSNADERERFAGRAKEARERFAVQKVAERWEKLFVELDHEKQGADG